MRFLPVNTMASDKQHCSCCSHPVSSPSVYQTLNEMEFERGLHSCVRHVVTELIRGTDKVIDYNKNICILF